MKLYTRSGDDGTTGLLFGGRGVEGGAADGGIWGHRYGHIGHGGMARALSSDERVKDILLRCQHDMFTAATEVAVDPAHYDLLIENFSPATEGMVERLEGWIDALDDEVDLPPRFIVSRSVRRRRGAIDLARTLTRDAERRIVALSETEPPKNDNVLRYVNRLSDLLFILARYEDRDLPFRDHDGRYAPRCGITALRYGADGTAAPQAAYMKNSAMASRCERRRDTRESMRAACAPVVRRLRSTGYCGCPVRKHLLGRRGPVRRRTREWSCRRCGSRC